MTKVEMVQQAFDALGEVSSQEVADYVQQTHGLFIEPAIVPIIRATIWSQELQEQFRREAKEALTRAGRAS